MISNPSLPFSFLFIPIFICISSCGKPETKSRSVWADADYKAAFVAKHRKQRYDIRNTSATPEIAVQRLIDGFCKAEEDPAAWLSNQQEHREIIWPNLPEADKPDAVHNPDAYWEVIQTLTGVVWPRMQSWEGHCLRLTKLEYRRDPEQYGELLLHYPGELELRAVKTGRVVPVDYIRTIVEHQGRFKVAQIGPD